MDRSERRALIERYTQGHAVVLAALEGITDAQMDADAAAEGWSPRQIVHHLADSEMTSAIRLRRLLAEDHPTLAAYDEMTFSRVLKYADRPIDAALDAFSAARRTTAEILARMTDADWAREGTHTDSGRYTAEDWLQIYAAHAHDHAGQILRARGMRSS
jgi:DinB superfamily